MDGLWVVVVKLILVSFHSVSFFCVKLLDDFIGICVTVPQEQLRNAKSIHVINSIIFPIPSFYVFPKISQIFYFFSYKFLKIN